MAELKTKKTRASVEKFLGSVTDPAKRADAFVILDIMAKAMKTEPKMWGSSIVGFGDVPLRYPSGRVLDWFHIGFSPRKQDLTLYILGKIGADEPLLKKLGRHRTGKGCLYIKRLEDIHLPTLRKLIQIAAKAERGLAG